VLVKSDRHNWFKKLNLNRITIWDFAHHCLQHCSFMSPMRPHGSLMSALFSLVGLPLLLQTTKLFVVRWDYHSHWRKLNAGEWWLELEIRNWKISRRNGRLFNSRHFYCIHIERWASKQVVWPAWCSFIGPFCIL